MTAFADLHDREGILLLPNRGWFAWAAFAGLAEAAQGFKDGSLSFMQTAGAGARAFKDAVGRAATLPPE